MWVQKPLSHAKIHDRLILCNWISNPFPISVSSKTLFADVPLIQNLFTLTNLVWHDFGCPFRGFDTLRTLAVDFQVTLLCFCYEICWQEPLIFLEVMK